MNSQSEKKSSEELKEKARTLMHAADAVTPCVAVTAQNWKSLTAAIRTQNEMMISIMHGQTELATKKELFKQLMDYTVNLYYYGDQLQQYAEDTKEILTKASSDFSSETEKAVSELSSQAGRVNEQFGRQLSSATEEMRRHTRRLFLISLIPSAALLLSELIPRILQLVS